MNDEKLLAVDLFSGAGGLSLGFTQTGRVQVIAAVENNINAQKTYKKNHKSVKIFGDIKHIDYNEILDECHKLGKDRINIVIGGPPCQGFSNANRQKEALISTNNQLVKEYVRAIQRLKPDAFVLENVKMMKSSKHKFFYSKGDKTEIVDELEMKLNVEKIVLGKTSKQMVQLIRYLNTSKENYKCIMIEDKIFLSKLNLLNKKEKASNDKITKIVQSLKSYFLRWNNIHNKYLNAVYEKKWIILGSYLNNTNHLKYKHEIFSILSEITEIQKILYKINELSAYKIDNNLIYDEENIYVEVQTYSVLDYLKAKFKFLGYCINEENLILNAAQFGAPQLRERLFLMGVKRNIVSDKKVSLPDPIILESEQFYTVRDAIMDLSEVKTSISIDKDVPQSKMLSPNDNKLLKFLNGRSSMIENHVITNTRSTALSRFKKLKPGQNFHHLADSDKKNYSDPGRTQNSVYLRLKYDSPSGTVLNVRKSMWIHPELDRAISIREAARLQTFPDDFIFKGAKDAQYQQIGNAVPPILSRAVAERILDYLNRPVKIRLKEIITPAEIRKTKKSKLLSVQ